VGGVPRVGGEVGLCSGCSQVLLPHWLELGSALFFSFSRAPIHAAVSAPALLCAVAALDPLVDAASAPGSYVSTYAAASGPSFSPLFAVAALTPVDSGSGSSHHEPQASWIALHDVRIRAPHNDSGVDSSP